MKAETDWVNQRSAKNRTVKRNKKKTAKYVGRLKRLTHTHTLTTGAVCTSNCEGVCELEKEDLVQCLR